MRYAFISDIHANIQAWETALQDICQQDINEIVCLGDIVGYGPYPKETLISVRQYTDKIVLGNHDAAVCGLMDTSWFYGEAERIVNWTLHLLEDEDLEFFKSLPLSLAADEFRVTHADFRAPGEFDYMEDEEAARAAWGMHEEPLMFIGHTHLPAIHMLDSEDNYVPVTAEKINIEPDCRYIVNVGSVGLPRDGDWRACYCIWDDDARTLDWRHVEYDIEAFREATMDIMGENEQVAYLYEDYIKSKENKARSESYKKKAFLTTQDLSELVQEFAPKQSGGITTKAEKRIRVRKTSHVTLEQREKQNASAEGKKWIVGLVIAGVLIAAAIILGFALIVGLAIRR